MSVVETALAATKYDDHYRQYSARGVRYAYSLLRNAADSEEVVQEAFCRLMRSESATPAANGSFPALFFTTVRNLCIDSKRADGRRKKVPLESAEHLSADQAEERTTELETALATALEALPSQWADALRLRMNGELNYEQIAHVLGCTHAQVRTWIYRARKQLATELGKRGLLDST